MEVDLAVPQRSDHPLIDAAGSFYWEHLMRFGVRVFLYQEGMLHAKTLTVNDELAMFGSANYNIRSFNLNFELNLFVHAEEAVRAMRRPARGLPGPLEAGHRRRLPFAHARRPAENEPGQALQPAALRGASRPQSRDRRSRRSDGRDRAVAPIRRARSPIAPIRRRDRRSRLCGPRRQGQLAGTVDVGSHTRGQ